MLLRKLYLTPKDFRQHLRYLPGAIIMEVRHDQIFISVWLIQSILGCIRYPSPSLQRSLYKDRRDIYGGGGRSRQSWQVSSRSHPYAFVLYSHFMDASHIGLVRHVPEWMPGASFRRKARIWRESIIRLPMAPYEAVNEALVSDSIHGSISMD